MIVRALQVRVTESLRSFPVVALLGPRQVGKTTLAHPVAAECDPATVYLDLERDSDLSKLQEAESYLGRRFGRLVILDEVQRRPDLFPLLRSLVDQRIRDGEAAGHYLVLGSASPELLRQSSESLAGRIAYLELKPFSLDEVSEVGDSDDDPEDITDRLWLRGGYPPSYLAAGDDASWNWRTNFIATYLERDLPQLGLRLPSEHMRRMWSMLGHGQGEPLNASRLATGLGVSHNTVRKYIDILTDLYMVRQLRPWNGNLGKRLVKSAKVYVRDSGLLHRLVNVPDLETLLGHPVCGRSWEGFVIETVLAAMPDRWQATYFRTAAQAEIDLVLEGPRQQAIAIEIKRTLSPKLSKGFVNGCEDIGATRRLFVMPSGEQHGVGHATDAVPLAELLHILRQEWTG